MLGVTTKRESHSFLQTLVAWTVFRAQKFELSGSRGLLGKLRASPFERTWGLVFGAILGLALGVDRSAHTVVRVSVASWCQATLKREGISGGDALDVER